MKRFTPVVAVLAIVAVLAVVAGVAAPPAAAEACFPLPQQAGFNFTSLTAVNVPCAEAHEVALHVARKGFAPADWSCKATVNGRYVSWACVHLTNIIRTVNFTYYVL